MPWSARVCPSVRPLPPRKKRCSTIRSYPISCARSAPGQSVRIEVDAYPGRAFAGRVRRVGEAATSQFALLPNPNPSGHFTKVTQRLPVRIEIEDPSAPLRPGMMVEVFIDVGRE